MAPALSLLTITSGNALAQEPSEPLLDELRAVFQRPYLSFGALVQVVGDFQKDRVAEGENGFLLANVRLLVYGDLDNGFGYFVQANLTSSPAVLDASIRYRVAPALTVEAGAFKAPFSRELLTFAGNIDFVDRAQVVTALVPGRQIGAQVRGRVAAGRVGYWAGAFNGNGITPSGNDNGELMYVARLSLWPTVAEGNSLEIGLNASTSRDEEVARQGTGVAGRRSQLGLDARLTQGRWLAAGELIAATVNPDGGETLRPWGWQITGGYMLTRKSQLLLRWDSYTPRGFAGGADSDLLIVGYNLWPTGATELQVNYLVPLNEARFDRHRILVNVQIGFF